MEPIRLLAVFAHPDDEGGAGSGALALNAAHGGESWLITATRGEVGEISAESDATPETLGDVRENELRAATAALGIHDPIFLGYRDSGMAGTPENDDARSLNQASQDVVVDLLIGHFQTIRPDVVLTFAEDGMYGHPDHVAVHKVTRRAVEQYRNRVKLDSYSGPKRLFYGVIVREWIREWVQQVVENQIELVEQTREWGTPLKDVSLEVNTIEVAGRKRKATASHVSQMDEMMKRFVNAPDEVLGREAYVLGWSADGTTDKKLSSFLDGFEG
jgi:N-acetyl-1-D-myo-inositol-2-amino-2-deoxy-alpha-D-glucopyranoside deacetylase